MARRVNTKFVVLLGGGMFVVAVSIMGFWWYNNQLEKDPVRLEARAQAAEKKGELDLAMNQYSRAAAELVRRHKPGADRLFVKTGDLAMALSAVTTDPIKAAGYYEAAKTQLRLALNENPQNLTAQREYIDENFKFASFRPSQVNWTAMEDAATKYIKLDATYPKAFIYRATAGLALARQGATNGGIDPARLVTVDQDIQKAMKLDPASATAVVLDVDLLATRAALDRSLNMTKDAEALDAAAQAALTDFLAKNPHDPEATERWSFMLIQQKHEDEAVKVLNEAIKVHPDSSRLMFVLATLMQRKNPDQAEEIYKNIIATNPNDPDSYLKLANFYQMTRKPELALECLKQALQHPNPGGGIMTQQNIQRQTSSLYMISWFYMDIAEREGVASPKGADAYTQAVNYANQLRSAQNARAMLDLLDGRLHLLKNNLSDAIASLKSADQFFNNSSRSQEWRQAKILLIAAYEKKTEWGNALLYIDQYLKVYPRSPSMLIREAEMLLNEAHYSDALAVIHDVSHPGPNDEIQPELVIEAKKTEARAQLGMGNSAAYLELMNELGGVDGQIATVVNLMANNEMPKAIEAVNALLKTAPDNERVYLLAVNINLRMGDEGKPEAAKLLAQAIEKFPKNTQFQMIKARLNSPAGNNVDTLVKAAASITDDYARNIYIAQVYLQFRNREQAIEYFNNAMKVLETNLTQEARDRLSRACDEAFTLCLAVAQDAEYKAATAAVTAAKAASAADKDKAVETKNQSAALAQKYWEQAKIYAQKAEALNLDGINGKLYQGELMFAKGGDSRDTGLSIIEQTVAAQPDNAAAHAVLGQAYVTLNQLDKALTEFQTAIKQKPDDLLALRYAINILIRKGEKGDDESLVQAKKYLINAMSFAPQDPMLKDFYDRIGNPMQAIRMHEAELAQHPDDANIIESLVRLYVKIKNIPKAIELLRPLYDKHPDDLEMANRLAGYYRMVQKYPEGARLYEHFLNNSNPAIRYEALILNGDYYHAMGQFDQAIAIYKDAINNEPAARDDATARLADLYFEIDHMADAEVLYQKIYQEHQDVRVARRLTEVFINQGKFAQADTLLASIFKNNPADVDGLNLKGYEFLQQRKSSEAIASFDAVLKAHPDNVDALHYRALAQYNQQGDLDQAMNDLQAIKGKEKTQELMADNRAGFIVQSRLLLARVYRLDRKYSEAAAEYDDLIKNAPTSSPAVRMEYAQYLLSLVEVFYRIAPDNRDDFAQSVRIVKPDEKLVDLLKDSETQLPGLPIWLIYEGNFLDLQAQKAIRENDPNAAKFAQAAELRYEAAFNNSRGNAQAATPYLGSLLNARKFQEVVDLATRLIADQPKYGDYYVKRGAAYAHLQDPKRALDDFHAALQLAGDDVALYLTVVRQAAAVLPGGMLAADLQARVAADKSDANAVIAVAEEDLAHNRGGDAVALLMPLLDQPKLAAQRPRVLRMIAMGKYQGKDFKGASKDYSELLKITPDDPEALNNFAFMLADDMHQPKEALPYAERAVKILRTGKIDVAFVNNGNVYDTYGWVKFLAGDNSGAVMELQKAVQIEPIPIAYLHLSKALMKDHRSREARKALEDGIQVAQATKDQILPELQAALQNIH